MLRRVFTYCTAGPTGSTQCMKIAQAHYRAALALEALGRTAEAVQRAERALSLQSSAGQGSGGQVSALADRLRGLNVGKSASSSAGRKPDASAAVADAGSSHFLQSAAPKLKSVFDAVSHGSPAFDSMRLSNMPGSSGCVTSPPAGREVIATLVRWNGYLGWHSCKVSLQSWVPSHSADEAIGPAVLCSCRVGGVRSLAGGGSQVRGGLSGHHRAAIRQRALQNTP